MEVLVRFEDLSAHHKVMLFNGCGPELSRSKWWTWIPVPELSFHECCNRHDFDYIVGGESEVCRNNADNAFLECMLQSASSKPWMWRWFYRRAAFIYYESVSKFGADHFKYRRSSDVVTIQMIMSEWSIRNHLSENKCVACLCMGMSNIKA